MSAYAPLRAISTHVPGPVEGARVSEAYARLIARDAYFWAWPMVNMYNRRLAVRDAKEPGLLGGNLPFAPLNRLSMLSDFVESDECNLVCPSQDVVYGCGMAALDVGPVVLQVPNFGARFWSYQVLDIRTDSFADIGAAYGTKPGFYLLVGPDWREPVPDEIRKVFRAKTNTVFVCPRVYQDDTPKDRAIVQSLIQGIDMYPLSLFDGQMKLRDWRDLPSFPQPTGTSPQVERPWVQPDKFFDQLPAVLEDAPPLPGEEARYGQLSALLRQAMQQPQLKSAMIDEATRTEAELISPLREFHNFGVPLPFNWTTLNNGAAFGTDYFTRTAVARSNMLVNKSTETKYFYLDSDAAGEPLRGGGRYTITFPKGYLPPVRGFWSLTLYDDRHFFVPNSIKRFSFGSRDKTLAKNPDGSLTLYIQDEPPRELERFSNWLPAPAQAGFSLYLRAYWPKEDITSGAWTPPAVQSA